MGVRMTVPEKPAEPGDNTPASDVPVTDRLETAVGLCRELETLCMEQAAAFEAADAERLDRATKQRQTVGDKLANAYTRLGDLKTEIATLDDAGQRHAGRLAAELGGLAERVARRDSELVGRMQGRTRDIVGQLSGLDSGQRAVSAYGGGKPRPEAGFQDRQA